MRPTTWGSLLAVCLLVPAASAEPAPAQPGGKVRPAWTEAAAGYGPSWADARQRALEEAQQKVADRLRREAPGLSWTPSVDDLLRWDVVTEVGRQADQPSPHVYAVRLEVTLTDANVREVLRQDHRQRVQQRQLLAAKVLAALVALLAVAAGYFRLEELTRGYYTGTLRLLLLACVGLIGAGVWLVL